MAERYMDAHDAMNDVVAVFSLNEALKKIVKENAG
jgi:hypothetical protein